MSSVDDVVVARVKNTDVPLSVIKEIVKDSSPKTRLKLQPYISSTVMWECFLESTFNNPAVLVVEQAIVYSFSFTNEKFLDKLGDFIFAYLSQRFTSTDDSEDDVNSNWENELLLKSLTAKGVSLLLRGLKNARASNQSIKIPYIVWEKMFEENYQRKSLPNFELDEINRTLNVTMWSSMDESSLHKLTKEKIVYLRETEYSFLTDIVASNLGMPVEWLEELYPIQG